MTKDEALKLGIESLEWHNQHMHRKISEQAITAMKKALAQPEQEPVTVLPDGSAFAVMSYPLPKDHWLYQERQYNDGEYEPVELGKPILTHEMRDAVVSAVRYAIRGATNCGKEVDFDPDALVQNAVYALCGPYTTPPQTDEFKCPLCYDDIANIKNSSQPEQERPAPCARHCEATAFQITIKNLEAQLAQRKPLQAHPSKPPTA